LPWALEIDPAHRPVGYELVKTFQPTFLYESIWCLFVFATIVWLERHRGLVKGQAFALYVAMYTFGRIFFEAMRVDPASKIFGIRFNLLLSAVLCVVATVWFVRLERGRNPASLATVPEEDQGSSG
jgi:prolipoprotein diacylglyceryltransferase